MSNSFFDPFSRRSFLKGSGVAAAATAMATAPNQAQAAQQSNVISGPTKISLSVNGKSHEVTVEPRTTLLDVLRYQLDLTGAKPVSSDASSGASTVLVDGQPDIRTVESLGGDDPDAVVKAFVEHDAQQCGFCTPGFVVAVRAFLNRNPKATEDEIRAGLNGNICRCGTYANVIQAALAVAKGGGNG
jgi:xanthine dehydrogenase YagT iron-sulfur-binding subunit